MRRAPCACRLPCSPTIEAADRLLDAWFELEAAQAVLAVDEAALEASPQAAASRSTS
jgi:hypothetical protein